jgi:hypothetical protein
MGLAHGNLWIASEIHRVNTVSSQLPDIMRADEPNITIKIQRLG